MYDTVSPFCGPFNCDIRCQRRSEPILTCARPGDNRSAPLLPAVRPVPLRYYEAAAGSVPRPTPGAPPSTGDNRGIPPEVQKTVLLEHWWPCDRHELLEE